jgi:hypothetical protein
MDGSIPPLPQYAFMAWCLVEKHRDNFGFGERLLPLCSETSSLLPKNLKIKVHKTVVFYVVLYGCRAPSLTLRKEHRLKMREIFFT